MSVRDPDPDPLDLEAEGLPAIEDKPEGTDDPPEGMVPPRDYPQASIEDDTTAAGQLAGESVAQRSWREEPEGFGVDEGGVGRLVQPDQGMPDLDAEPTEMADESDDDAGLTAEEAAVHITDSP
jgi:hypothetical protein